MTPRKELPLGQHHNASRATHQRASHHRQRIRREGESAGLDRQHHLYCETNPEWAAHTLRVTVRNQLWLINCAMLAEQSRFALDEDHPLKAALHQLSALVAHGTALVDAMREANKMTAGEGAES